jgi:hypothetical protein
MSVAAVYGCAMRQAVAGGDLDEMRKLAGEAKAHLAEYGNVPLALEVLKTEIAKAEEGERRRSTRGS